MSKQIRASTPVGAVASPSSTRRHFACFFVVFLCLLSIAAAGLTGSAQRAQSPVPSAAARNAAVIAATQEVLKETSEIRQLSILRPVQSSAQSRAEIERSLIKSLDEDTTPAEMHADEVTLKKLGLAPPEFQYRALMLRVLTEQVAGYYDPKTQQFHLADWIDLDGQKPIMAHELTHALQDQHFDLRRFEHWPKGDSDAELAVHALIEGDATLAMALYVAKNPLRALAFLKSVGVTGIATEELDKAPRALRETLLFPYQDGEKWVSALYKQGGWGEVSQAFTTLPQSSEQILHPEKYFAHEAPVKVTLPDISDLLNDGPRERSKIRGQRSDSSLITHNSSLPGWHRINDDVQGEWGLYLMLDQFLKSPAESRRAAAGWGGDRFAVYENSRGQACLVSLSVWDTENDAREFFEAYVKRTRFRYGETVEMSADSNVREPNSQWKTDQGLVTVELRGSRVLIVEGYPENTYKSALTKLLWQ